MKGVLLIGCMLLIVTATASKDFTLMHPELNIHTKPQEFILQGICYIDASSWVIWVNDVKVSPENIPSWLRITSVTAALVECEYLKDDKWVSITLYP